MPALITEVRHLLGQDLALEKLKAFLDGVQQRYQGQVDNLRGEWTENCLNYSFAVLGLQVQGKLIVLQELARIEAQIPFAAMAFRGRIEQEMRADLARILS